MTTRRALVVTFAAALAVGAVIAGLAATGAFGQDSGSSAEPAAKQTVEAIMAEEQATAEAAVPPGATKEPFTPVPTPKSCPIDPGMYRTEITGPVHEIPAAVTKVVGVVNQAGGLTSEGAPYSIFAGASRGDPSRGAIAVWLGAKDPCAEGRVDYPPKAYLTPFEGGAATLTEIAGDTVEFQTADGMIGRLNFVTGKFE